MATALAEVGIEVDRYGKVELDADKFAAAYAADPAKVSGLFVDTDPDAPAATNTDHGFATALESLAKRLSNSSDGVVTSLVKGRQSAIDGLKDAIEGWDARLAAAAFRARAAVRRPRGRARQAAEPVLVAGRPDRFAPDHVER